MPSSDLADVLRDCSDGFEHAAKGLSDTGQPTLEQFARAHQQTLRAMAIMAEEIAELKARVAEWT